MQEDGDCPFCQPTAGGGIGFGLLHHDRTPGGRRSRKPRYTFPDLEPLYPVHKVLREMATKYTEKLGKRVETAQVSINWVRAKGAIPLVGVKNANQARDMVDATKWDLDEADVKTLDEVAMDTFKKRRKINELIAKARK